MAVAKKKEETVEPKTLPKKLLEFQSLGLSFEKTADNPFFKSKYTPLDDLNKIIKPKLTELGLVISHTIKDGCVVTSIICVDTKELIESTICIPSGITDPQKIGSAVTYFKRYNTVALLNLDSDTDSDGQGLDEKPVFGTKELEAMKKSMIEGKFEIPKTKEELIKEIEKKYKIEDKSILDTLYK